ncbi:hypothetical protein PVAP13_2NG269303 [Panicum virgatum]|uniref:Uncharacterized protein n=1 Tax=Panicum virgatum TaxID=38727 RepID=A0A8T0VJ88_PANVG|nr:hypothetical protein PVAP13_2NG269303 [Panicum virgatum]
MLLARRSSGGHLAGVAVLGRRAMGTVAKGTNRAAVHGSRSPTNTAVEGREEAEEAIERGKAEKQKMGGGGGRWRARSTTRRSAALPLLLLTANRPSDRPAGRSLAALPPSGGVPHVSSLLSLFGLCLACSGAQ